MRGTLRQTRLKDWYEVINETCPICNKSGGCLIHADGNRVVCIRVESKTVFSTKLRSWLHFLKEPRPAIKQSENFIPTTPKAPVQQLQHVFGALLDCTNLKAAHFDHLSGASRGLNNHEIEQRQYRTFPDKPWATIKSLTDYVDESAFEGVPGFYKNQYGWTIKGYKGLMIPYRNEFNQVTGFQVRLDDPGFKTVIEGTFQDKVTATIIEKPNLVQVKVNGEVNREVRMELDDHIEFMENGNYGRVYLKKGQRYFWLSSANKDKGTGAGNPLPVHIAVPSTKLKDWDEGTPHQTESVWITEGALKADIAVEHMERLYRGGLLKDGESSPTFIGLPGVETWFNVLDVLKNMKTKRVTIAYDMDMLSNVQVLRAVKEFIGTLKEKGYEVRLAMWNEEDGKGIDDSLINGKFPQVRNL